MTGTNAPAQPNGTAPAAGGDPSMEDILASIRKILNEEDTGPAAPAVAAQPPAETGGHEDDVLMLDESMMVPEADTAPANLALATPEQASPEPAAYAPAAPTAAIIGRAESEPPVAPPEAEPPKSAPEPTPHRVFAETPPFPTTSLVAPEAAAAAASSVGNLVRTLAAERAMKVHTGGPTIEEIVREEIRPLLKTWLDENLPPMVERLVRLEIERVVGRVVP
jgi:uncharacterized protein